MIEKGLFKTPHKVIENLKNRFTKNIDTDRMFECYNRSKQLRSLIEEYQSKKKKLAKEFSILKSKKVEDTNNIITKSKTLGEELKNLESRLKGIILEFNNYYYQLPNIIDKDVPIGKSEAENKIIAINDKNKKEEGEDHYDYALKRGWIDTKRAAKISGSRFTIFKGDGALLERAIGQYMLDKQISNGYEELSVPLIVNEKTMFGTGQLPKFSEDLYKISNEEKDRINNSSQGQQGRRNQWQEGQKLKHQIQGQDQFHRQSQGQALPNQNLGQGQHADDKKQGYNQPVQEKGGEVYEKQTQVGQGQDKQSFYLIPTAEVPLTNLYRDEIIPINKLPIKMTSLTSCFRQEAGSYGKDVRGFLRQHQFNKVEMVVLCTPNESKAMHEKMILDAKSVLDDLELPYRLVNLASGDLGFNASKCIDIEVWLPSQKTFREISSCSNCTDFQSRRSNIRFKSERDKKPQFIHSLNGSGLAVGRTLIALIENHQIKNGKHNDKIYIPKALRSYLNGVEYF